MVLYICVCNPVTDSPYLPQEGYFLLSLNSGSSIEKMRHHLHFLLVTVFRHVLLIPKIPLYKFNGVHMPKRRNEAMVLFLQRLELMLRDE
jgi:hypothetical protein